MKKITLTYFDGTQKTIKGDHVFRRGDWLEYSVAGSNKKTSLKHKSLLGVDGISIDEVRA